jgi:hypothetical protein
VRVDDSDPEAEKCDISVANLTVTRTECSLTPALSRGLNDGKRNHHSSYISSKDAYMLIYARHEAGTSNTNRHELPEPPLLARERIANLNGSHDDTCAVYMKRSACGSLFVS